MPSINEKKSEIRNQWMALIANHRWYKAGLLKDRSVENIHTEVQKGK